MSSAICWITPRSLRKSAMRRDGCGLMEDMLTQAERAFLSRYGLPAAAVYDPRGRSGSYWKRRIREENNNVALGAPCGNAGHRLRIRAGHCVQCDPKKLAFQARHSAEQYVYIAGSVSEGLIRSERAKTFRSASTSTR
jgi:hypothetical protein